MTFKGTVTKGQVVVTGVDLPDGTKVDVEVRPHYPDMDTIFSPDFPADIDLKTVFPPEVNEDIAESQREYERGEYWADEDAKAAIRSVFTGEPVPPFTPERERRERALARKARQRTKPAARRSR